MAERTALYRIFGDADLLLYVGISDNFGRRWKEHAKRQPWWNAHQRMTVDWHPSSEAAGAAETTAIRLEMPKYNIAHVVPRPRPATVIPPLWDGDGDVLTQIERLLTSGCQNQGLITLLVMALIEGYRELPVGVELEGLAARVQISRSNAYRYLRMMRQRSDWDRGESQIGTDKPAA